MATKLKFPYRFKGFVARESLNKYILANRVRFIPARRCVQHLGKESLPMFANIYTNILQAMVDFDYEYLSNVMEPKLFSKCKEGLDHIQDNKYKLEFVEQAIYDPGPEDSEDEIMHDKKNDEDKDKADVKPKYDINGNKLGNNPVGDVLNSPIGFLYGQKDLLMFIESKGIFGAHITRSKNKDLVRKFGDFRTTYTVYKDANKSLLDSFRRQILVLNIYYYTSKKLVLKDEDGVVLKGSTNPKDSFDHKFRFETYTDKIDWVLCDIDDHLHGNPYVILGQKESE